MKVTHNNTLQVDASTVTRFAEQNPRRQRVAPELNRLTVIFLSRNYIIENLNKVWSELKEEMPLGSVIRGIVIESQPFGLFVDIGYGKGLKMELTGIIDLGKNKLLSTDRNNWPQVGDKIEGKVIWFREYNKEVDLHLECICNE